jgi:hypothetical protein
MKENQRTVLIIGVSLALLELLCPPSNVGRLIFGISPDANFRPTLDNESIVRHLAIIGLATLFAYLACASTTLRRIWDHWLGPPS